jgi:hypothetical protein
VHCVLTQASLKQEPSISSVEFGWTLPLYVGNICKVKKTDFIISAGRGTVDKMDKYELLAMRR